MRTVYAFPLLVLLATGCATTSGIRQEPLDRGVERVFSSAFPDVLEATRAAVVESGLSIESAEEVGEGLWVIVGQKDASVWSWGELVRVVVDRRGDQETTVRVLTQRRLATNVTADDDHSDSIFGAIALRLAGGGG